jgi:hypothetical protein
MLGRLGNRCRAAGSAIVMLYCGGSESTMLRRRCRRSGRRPSTERPAIQGGRKSLQRQYQYQQQR